MERRRALPAVLILLSAGCVVMVLLLLGRAADRHPAGTNPSGTGGTDAGSSTGRLRGAARTPGNRAPDDPPRDARESEDDAEDDEDGWAEPSLRVDVVDARTGGLIAARWNLGTGRVTAGPFPPGAVVTEEALERQRESVRESIARWETEFLDAGQVRADALYPDSALDVAYAVRLPAGYVLEDPHPRIVGRIAAGVRQALVVVPAWDEAVLEVAVRDEEGHPVDDAGIDTLVVAGRVLEKPKIEKGDLGPGRLRVRDIPRLVGEPVVAYLDGPDVVDREPVVEAPVVEVDAVAGSSAAPLSTRIPADPSVPWRVEVRLPRRRAEAPYQCETDNDLPYEEILGEDDGPNDGPTASVRLRAQGWDGRAIREADVWIDGEEWDTMNDAGAMLLVDLAPGEHEIVVRSLRNLTARAAVRLPPGEETAVTVREPHGAAVEVVVTDGEGRPRPFARLDLGGRPVFDVESGVQRLDLYTDVHGRRRLARVEPGRTAITARWGSRRGRRVVDLEDRTTTTVPIVAR